MTKQIKNKNCLRSEALAKGWRKMRLGDVATLHRGYDLPIGEIKKGEYPVVFSNGKIEYHNEYKIKGPGVITGRSGTLGNTFYIEENYWPHNTTLYVCDFHGNDPRFIYYLLERLNLAKLNAGSGVPTLNRNHAHEILVNIPKDPKEQKRIADVLSAFDDKIELNNKINDNLEKMAQGIFKEWFIKNAKCKMQNAKLETICDIIYGKDLPVKNLKKTGFPVYGGNGIIGYSEKYLYNKPHIIIGCRGAYSGNIFKTEPKSFVTHNSLVLKIKKDQTIGINYLFYALQKSNIKSSVTGSAQPQITITELNKIEIPISNKQSAQEFEIVADTIENYKYKNMKENQKLASLRDLLLPRLMSGEVEV